jgi:hypothetical protein
MDVQPNVYPKTNTTLIYTLFGISLFLIIVAIGLAVYALLKGSKNGTNGTNGTTGATGATGSSGAGASSFIASYKTLSQVVTSSDPSNPISVIFDADIQGTTGNGITRTPSVFTFSESGLYQINFTIQILANSSSANSFNAYISQNNNTVPGSSILMIDNNNANGNIFILSNSVLLTVNSGDTIQLLAVGNPASSFTISGGEIIAPTTIINIIKMA